MFFELDILGITAGAWKDLPTTDTAEELQEFLKAAARQTITQLLNNTSRALKNAIAKGKV